jgi:hypothetical protein
MSLCAASLSSHPAPQLIVKLTQTMMGDRLMFVADTQCTGARASQLCAQTHALHAAQAPARTQPTHEPMQPAECRRLSLCPLQQAWPSSSPHVSPAVP